MLKKTGSQRTSNAIWLAGISVLCFGWFASTGCAQKINVRTERAPYFVGETIVLEIEAIDFKIDPAIEIKNSDQENVSVTFANSGRSTSTQIFQSGGKFVRNQIVKTTFSYRIAFSKAGLFSIGPFEANSGGDKVIYPAVEFDVSDIETTPDMKVEISLPQKNLYPGQQVPVKLRWIYAGNPRLVKGLTIRNEIFERFRFKDEPLQRGQSAIPITTSKGVLAFPAEFAEEEIDGKKCFVGTVERTMIPEKPEAVSLPPTFVSFQKVTGRRRSSDILESFFEVQADTVPFKGIGEPVNFVVKPFPLDGRPNSFSNAVGSNFEISTSVNRNNLRTGDPITLQINIQGDGNVESIGLPPLEECFSKEDFDWPSGDHPGVTEGTRKQFNINLRAKSEQLTEIPPVEFSYFDPRREEYVTVRSDAIAIDVTRGDVVSSRDIVGQLPKESDMDDFGIKMDLAIETDVDKLIDPESRSPWIEYGLYLVGILLVCFSFFGAPSTNDKSRAKQNRKQLAAWRKKLVSICNEKGDGNSFLSRLSDHLRMLQSLLSQLPDGEIQLTDQSESVLDELIGEIDKVSYRPSTPSAEELKPLVESANRIARELGQR